MFLGGGGMGGLINSKASPAECEATQRLSHLKLNGLLGVLVWFLTAG